MRISPLETARHNYAFHLQRLLDAAKPPQGITAERLATTCFAWRILALCALLQEADADTFAVRLCKSAQVRLALLRLAERVPVAPRLLCCSKDLGFGAALAAGDISLAVSIAKHSPSAHFPEVEYEDDFLFFHLLHRMVLEPGDADGRARLLQRWKQVEQDHPSARFELCQALSDRDRERFPAAFEALLEHRRDKLRAWRKRMSFDPELDATEGKIFIEGLAVLRLAEMNGLPTRSSHELIPPIARLALDGCRLPEDAWRET